MVRWGRTSIGSVVRHGFAIAARRLRLSEAFSEDPWASRFRGDRRRESHRELVGCDTGGNEDQPFSSPVSDRQADSWRARLAEQAKPFASENEHDATSLQRRAHRGQVPDGCRSRNRARLAASYRWPQRARPATILLRRGPHGIDRASGAIPAARDRSPRRAAAPSAVNPFYSLGSHIICDHAPVRREWYRTRETRRPGAYR